MLKYVALSPDFHDLDPAGRSLAYGILSVSGWKKSKCSDTHWSKSVATDDESVARKIGTAMMDQLRGICPTITATMMVGSAPEEIPVQPKSYPMALITALGSNAGNRSRYAALGVMMPGSLSAIAKSQRRI